MKSMSIYDHRLSTHIIIGQWRKMILFDLLIESSNYYWIIFYFSSYCCWIFAVCSDNNSKNLIRWSVKNVKKFMHL